MENRFLQVMSSNTWDCRNYPVFIMRFPVMIMAVLIIRQSKVYQFTFKPSIACGNERFSVLFRKVQYHFFPHQDMYI